jgi:hypothetical protein
MQASYVTIHYTPCHHPLHAMSSSTKPSIHVFKWFSVTDSMYLWVPHQKILVVEIHLESIIQEWFHSQKNTCYNVVYKWMLSCNHFCVSTFTIYLQILFNKFPQQRAGYHLVNYNLKRREYKTITSCLAGYLSSRASTAWSFYLLLAPLSMQPLILLNSVRGLMWRVAGEIFGTK